MRRVIRLALCVPVTLSALGAAPVHAATGTAIRLTHTSAWSTPSHDPMGITYDPRTGRLLICDSEVDEMPALWKGSNFFVVKRAGGLVAPRTFKTGTSTRGRRSGPPA